MTQVVLPNTITAGQAINAAPLQGNYTALRDVVNGQLEGGSGVDSNIKANGITAREIADLVLPQGVQGPLQAGAVGAGDLKVTPGAGLTLNYASGTLWITDSGSVIAGAAGLVPAIITGGSVTIAANASGNPRIDQVIATLTGWGTATVSVLQGTATAAATLDNRTGAAALPASSIRLADILMPTGFAGPFVQNTHIRDRRPWARGAYVRVVDTGGNYSVTSTTYAVLSATRTQVRVETSGNPVRVMARARGDTAATSGQFVLFAVLLDGALDTASFGSSNDIQGLSTPAAAQMVVGSTFSWDLLPAAGSHTIGLAARVSVGAATVWASGVNALNITVEELLRANSANDGA